MNRKLYNKLVKGISESIKLSLMEFNVFGVSVPSLVLQKMSDIDDLDKDVNWEDKGITKTVQDIFEKMKKNVKFSDFLKTNNVTDTILYSYKVDTACTDGYKGQIIMNPLYILGIYDKTGEIGVLFIILHETMHNYYNNVKHALKINTPGDNIIIDRRINNEIVFRWHEFKGVPELIGALM